MLKITFSNIQTQSFFMFHILYIYVTFAGFTELKSVNLLLRSDGLAYIDQNV